MKLQAQTLLLASLLAVPASASTICVKPTGSTTTTGNPCYANLGYALAGTAPAVAAGDVITVAAGVYKETGTVTINSTLTGLKIVGPAAAIIDNESGTGAMFNIIQVDASGVMIQGLTLRNGRNEGIWVISTADNFTLIGTTFNGMSSNCLDIAGDDAIVKSAKFSGCGSDGITFYGKNVTVTNSVFRNIDCHALYGDAVDHDFGTVTFSHNTVSQAFCSAVWFKTPYAATVSPGVSNAVIQSNAISNLDSYGIYVENAGAHTAGTAALTGNKITNVHSDAIYLFNMDANVVTANQIKHVSDAAGMEIIGGGAHTILSNSISGTFYSGIYVSHAYAGNEPDGSVIKLNKITDAIDGQGIFARHGKGMTISNNTITNAYSGLDTFRADTPTVFGNNISNVTYDGVYVYCSDVAGTSNTCTGATIANNHITGTQEGSGILFDGDLGTPAGGIQIISNIVKSTTYSGLDLSGENMTISKNQALYTGSGGTGTGWDGFYVSGNGNTLTSNIARYASGDGFFINGGGATLTSNTADHNSEDGFDLHSSTTGTATFNSNHATLNAGTGFEIDINDTVTTTGLLNTAANNGINSCDAGIGTLMLVNGLPLTGGLCNEASGYIGD